MKNKNSKNGFTLVEAMIALGILAFLIVSVLSGFTHQKIATRKVADKNIALTLAELRMQELHKFRSTQLTAGIFTDWIVHDPGGLFTIYTDDPNHPDQYRRTTVIAPETGDVLAHKMVIQVMVEYGKDRETYPFRVVLSTKRGL